MSDNINCAVLTSLAVVVVVIGQCVVFWWLLQWQYLGHCKYAGIKPFEEVLSFDLRVKTFLVQKEDWELCIKKLEDFGAKSKWDSSTVN